MKKLRHCHPMYKGIYTPKLPKLDLTTDKEYAANLCGCKCATVQFIT